MATVVGINHVGISVTDLTVARAFWAAIGFVEVSRFAWGAGTSPADDALGLLDSAAEVVVLAGATSYLELFAFAAPAPALRDESSPGIAGITVAVADLATVVAALRRLGCDVRTSDVTAGTTCPDGTPIELVTGDPTGLRRVVVRVPDPAVHPLPSLPGRVVTLDVEAGGDGTRARPCDLGANHLCLDVVGVDAVRADLARGVRWHHEVTASSGGIASVCYGTTVDGVLVELLESHSPDATLSRARLSDG